ncbi:MAG TPA: hypothetical protein VIM63_12960 [Rhodoferax sp.]
MGILKMVLLRLTRSDQYRAGPFEVRRTAKATSTSGNNKTSPAQAPAIRSNSLFMQRTSSAAAPRSPTSVNGCQEPSFGNIHLQIAAQALHCIAILFKNNSYSRCIDGGYIPKSQKVIEI